MIELIIISYMLFIMFLWFAFAIFIYSKIPDRFKKTKNCFIALSLIILALIPTYDIIITNILGKYYYYTMPKPFLEEKFDRPISLYVEDRIMPFSPKERESLSNDYLFAGLIEEVDISKIALNGDDGLIYIYYIDRNSTEFSKYEELIKEMKLLKKAQEESYNIYVATDKIDTNETKQLHKAWKDLEDKAKDIGKEISSVKEKMIKTDVVAKDKLSGFDYTRIRERLKTNIFVNYFVEIEVDRLIDNKTSQLVGYRHFTLRPPYNLFPNFASGKKARYGMYDSISHDIFYLAHLVNSDRY